jgi:hypothetical protein
MKLNLIKSISRSMNTRYVKYGGFAAIVTVALIAAVIILNLIIQQVSPQFDMTENRLFSLSEQSVQVLEAVKSPVNIYGVWQPGSDTGRIKEIKEVAELYTARSRFIRFQEIDPDLNPGLLQRFDRDNTGISTASLIVEGEKGFKVLPPQDMYDTYYNSQQGSMEITGIGIEKQITAALIYISTGETPAVYEISGHNETPLSAYTTILGIDMQGMIGRENYALKQHSLIQSSIPEDASALILNNPRTAFTELELERLGDYLEKGGRLLVMLDYRSGAIEGLNTVLASYGIRYDHGVVIENDVNYRVYPYPAYIFAAVTNGHGIVKPLEEKQSPVFNSYAMGISTLDMRRRTTKVEAFLSSSPGSYLQTDLESDAPDQGTNIPGPLSLGVAVMDPEYNEDGPQTRIVALGSSVLELLQMQPANVDLFMNCLTWIEERPDALSIRSRSAYTLPLMMNALPQLIFGLLFVVIIPLSLFVLALVTWLRRRHL